MIVGSEKVSEQINKILAKIEQSDPDELIEIDEVMILVAVHYGSDPIEETETGSLFYRCTSSRAYIQHGLLVHAIDAVKANTREE